MGTPDFGIRLRNNGGYNIAERNLNVAYLAPDSFKLFAANLPTLTKSWREFTVRLPASVDWPVTRRVQPPVMRSMICAERPAR